MSVPVRFEKILKKPIIQDLSRLFSSAGKNIYLVGGSVRDCFIDQAQDDLDFTTEALPDEIENIVKKWADELWLIGKEYGTIGLSKDGHKAEITTFRADIYKPESRHPEVNFSKTIEEDLKRRDFTVNAMALKLPQGEPIDPYNGLSDLQSKTLKTPQDASKSFTDDPLRMLRALRFMSTLGLKPDKAVLEGIRSLKERLAIISKERIKDELSRLLTGLYPVDALRLLVKSGLDEYVVPELSTLQMETERGYHHKDVLEHTFKVVDGVKTDLVLRLSALLHDIAKPKTKTVTNGEVHFYGHDVIGARMARKRLRELRYPKDIVEKVTRLIRLHLRPYNYAMGWTDSAVRRYARDAGDMLPRLNQLAIADCTTRIKQNARRNLELILDLEKRVKKLNEEEDIAKIRAPIDGEEIMKHLNLEPGKKIGEAIDMLLEAKLDDKIKTKEEAYKMLDEWAKNNL